MSDEIVKAITRLEVQMEAVHTTLAELKVEVRAAQGRVLPVTGGVVGVLAAAWTAYVQASGQA